MNESLKYRIVGVTIIIALAVITIPMLFQGTGQKVVCSDTTNEDMIGVLLAADNDDDNATKAWVALVGDAFASINMNSVAQGHPGSQFTVTNIAADVWKVEGVVIQSGGSEATPFATT